MVHKKKIPKGFPFYGGEKAKFPKGELVFLTDAFMGNPIFAGMVVGRGKDQYGEHQKVKILWSGSRYDKVGETKSVRLMDLASLRSLGNVFPKFREKVKNMSFNPQTQKFKIHFRR